VEAGASGYYSRDIEPGQVRKAQRRPPARSGGRDIRSRRYVVTVRLDAFRAIKPVRRLAGRSVRLTQLALSGEHQIAQLIAADACEGYRASADISERTVKAHLTELFWTLQVSDRLQLAVLLNREG
jgi:hypothetical protein